MPVPDDNLHTTKGPSHGAATDDQLSFGLDEVHHLQSEAEALRRMLNTVRFTLVRRLGAGGMGVVYEAYDQERGELVALKTMRRVDPVALVRFKQEFRSLCDITHPNLVNLYELFAVDDRWFFTMELVEGCDFVTYVKQRTAPGLPGQHRIWASPERASKGALPSGAPGEPPARQLFDEGRLRGALLQLALGIDALHQSGKLHRDIKPPNVLVSVDGRVVLLDFGLTADLERSGRTRAVDRQVVGTVGHMSPEQAAGRAGTTASDWYSVGVMLFEAMTGRLPFVGAADEVMAAKQVQQPLSPAELVEGLPVDLVGLCTALLNPNPARRPTGKEVITLLSGRTAAALSADGAEPARTLPLIGHRGTARFSTVCLPRSSWARRCRYSSSAVREPARPRSFARFSTP